MNKITIKEIINILGLVLIWRALLQFIAWIARTRLNVGIDFAYQFDNPNPWINDLPNWLATFANWDSGWYLSIAERGYEYIGAATATNVVFFPLYPILMRFVSWSLNNQELLAGIILSHLFLVLAAIYLYKLVKIDYSAKTAWRSVLYMLLFPVAFFFTLVYTESLFIFLAILAFYLARKHLWALASITAFFLSLTKPWGVAVVIPLAIEYFEQRDFSFKNMNLNFFFLGFAPIGTFVYMLYLKIKFGSWLLFASSQKLWHEETAFNFFQTITNYWNNIFITISDNLAYQTAISFDFGFFVFGIIMSVLIFLKVRKSYGVYALLATLIPALTGIMVSMSRYVLIIFPIYILLAKWGKKKIVNASILMVFTMLLAYFMVLFVHNYWIA